MGDRRIELWSPRSLRGGQAKQLTGINEVGIADASAVHFIKLLPVRDIVTCGDVGQTVTDTHAIGRRGLATRLWPRGQLWLP